MNEDIRENRIYQNELLYTLPWDKRIHVDREKAEEIWRTRPEPEDEICEYCGHVGVPVYRDGGFLKRCPECGASWRWALNKREVKLVKVYSVIPRE